jgi:hypothetical protein
MMDGEKRKPESAPAQPTRPYGVPPARDVDHHGLLDRLRGLRERRARNEAEKRARPPRRFRRTRKVLKWIFGILGILLLLVVLAIATVWTFPELVLTRGRVNSLASGFLVQTSPRIPYALPAPDSGPVTLKVGKPDWRTRAFQVAIAPGCYRLGGEGAKSEGCFDVAEVEVAIRLHLKTIAQIAWVGPIRLHSTSATIRPSEEKKKKKEEEKASEPFDPSKYLKYVAKDFHWNPIDVRIDGIHIPASGVDAKAAIRNTTVRTKFDSVQLMGQATGVSADKSRWTAALDGIATRVGKLIKLPKLDATYNFGKNKASRIKADLAATFDTEKTTVGGKLNADWTAPFSQARSLKIRDGDFFASQDEFRTRSTVALVLAGVTRMGKPPVMSIRVEASRLQKTADRVDFKMKIDEYSFAGLDLLADAEFAMVTAPGKDRIDWKRGQLRVGTDDFKKTIRAFRRTPWAVPAPFAVLNGPIWLETGAIRNEKGALFIPLTLKSNLTSREQTVALGSDVQIRLDSQQLTPKDIGVTVKIDKLRLRLPNYDPISPTPALFRDSRIISKEQLAQERVARAENLRREQAETVRVGQSSAGRRGPTLDGGKPAEPPKVPTRVTIQGGPSSIQLLNRFFEPELDAEIDVTMDSTRNKGALTGVVETSKAFTIHYLNRDITVEGIAIILRPELQVDAQFSMDRAGYHVIADFTQRAGRSRIDLTSEPLLSEDEIVSLMLYGQPRSSVTADQDSSVGSAQAAMSSQALGIFSLWAFASTPIEAVLYDPATKTYQAVVRLPGGVTASIGNNWEDEKQVALSKSIGKNWAISTELIQGANDVNRAGTMLRWRKRY